MKFLKYTHPDLPGYIIMESDITPEDVREGYMDPEASLGEFQVEEVEMTPEEFYELPEYHV